MTEQASTCRDLWRDLRTNPHPEKGNSTAPTRQPPAASHRRTSRWTSFPVLLALLLAIPLFIGPQRAQAGTVTSSIYGSYSSAPNLVFDRGTNSNSELRVYVSLDGVRWRLKMRSGSGTGTNDCVTNVGWAPLGTFSVNQHWYAPSNLRGSAYVIEAFAFSMSNMDCTGGGTTRTALFIHSEMNYDTSAPENYTYDDSSAPEQDRWDGTNDYYSAGCLKIHPEDMLVVSEWFLASYSQSSAHGSVVS